MPDSRGSSHPDTAARDNEISTIRPWPAGVERRGLSRQMFEAYREAFDADPASTFCAGEHLGVTMILAVGEEGRQLQAFVQQVLHGEIEQMRPEWTEEPSRG